MPELAEVEHSRRQWDVGKAQSIQSIHVRPGGRVFRGVDTDQLRRELTGQNIVSSEARGKQMLFQFSNAAWLGLHLGMRGELFARPADYVPGKHDHLILHTAEYALVFEDQRHFGRVQFHQGAEPPAWWSSLAPSVLSDAFNVATVTAFLLRRRNTPIKAVLLMQERFPGVGNWMADEILWRAGIHPATLAGALDAARTNALWKQTRWVSRTAIRIITDDWTYPDNWLFTHRWDADGHCPHCGIALERAQVGGRTTCWCPNCQKA
jgi:formamidopyrimidine-DNA glycosylase